DDEDPNFEVALDNAVLGDTFDVTYNRELGEDVGSYVVTANFVDLNYTITFIEGTLTINPRPLTATINPQQQVYGDAEKGLTYTLSEEDYRDELDLDVERAEGSIVGAYRITASTLNSNFALTVVENNYVITKRVITVSQTETYLYNGTIQTIDLTITN